MNTIQEMLDSKNNEIIENVDYSDIMGNSYVNYAMSVIMARAVPDIRDGLKPVQRRIMYDMYKLGATSDKPHRKSARVVGDTMGKYHPHGDCLAGNTVVRLADGTTATIEELYYRQEDVEIIAVNKDMQTVKAMAHDFRIGQCTNIVYDIQFINGYTVSVTDNHPFLTIDKDWVKARDLHPHMILEAGILGELSIENELKTLLIIDLILHKSKAVDYKYLPPYNQADHDNLLHAFYFDVSFEEYEKVKTTHVAIIKSITQRQVNFQPMYDFTVDEYHNMLINIDASNTLGVFAHNSSIYEAMVNMSQDFKKNQPLVAGHGNFGSIEGDGAAAQRYTEARLEEFAEDVLLEDLKYDTVNMVSNYDETEVEPEVLPCKIPNLLINGAEGIAVGMATSIPPHNISNVIDCTVKYLQGETNIDRLVEILQGPDFPTGGIIANKHDLLNIYSTGTGRIRIRGRIDLDENNPNRLIVSAIPYTMVGDGINKFLNDLVKLSEDKILPEIVDIINQSKDKDIRIIIEVKPKSDINRIKNIIYKKTKLEDTFSVNMLAINQGIPRVMNLLDILDAFATFQNELYTRKFNKLLEQARHKKEISEGLIQAVDIIDIIIAILKGSNAVAQAKKCLMKGDITDIEFSSNEYTEVAKNLRFTEIQADAILSMQLSRLVNLELKKLQTEYDSLVMQIDKWDNIISDPNLLKKEIISYLNKIEKSYGKPRKTELADLDIVSIDDIEVPEVELMVLIDKFNYIHAIDKSAYSRNNQYIDENFVYKITISNKDKLAIFTDIGKVHLISMKDLPIKKPRDKGVPLDNICQFNYKTETIVGVHSLGFKSNEKEFIFVTTDGYVKRTKNTDFFINRKITDSTLLRDNAKVFAVFPYEPQGYLVLKSAKGYILKGSQDSIKLKSRYSQGTIGIKLNPDDILEFAAADAVEYKDVNVTAFGTAGKVRTINLLN